MRMHVMGCQHVHWAKLVASLWEAAAFLQEAVSTP